MLESDVLAFHIAELTEDASQRLKRNQRWSVNQGTGSRTGSEKPDHDYFLRLLRPGVGNPPESQTDQQNTDCFLTHACLFTAVPCRLSRTLFSWPLVHRVW